MLHLQIFYQTAPPDPYTPAVLKIAANLRYSNPMWCSVAPGMRSLFQAETVLATAAWIKGSVGFSG